MSLNKYGNAPICHVEGGPDGELVSMTRALSGFVKPDGGLND